MDRYVDLQTGMNEEQDPESTIDAETSLCWKCKHGICVKETEQERIYHANMRGLPGFGNLGGPQPPGADQFGIFEEAPFREQSDEEPELLEHTVEHERVKTICFWRPAGVQSPPILTANVQQCNRFEQQ